MGIWVCMYDDDEWEEEEEEDGGMYVCMHA